MASNDQQTASYLALLGGREMQQTRAADDLAQRQLGSHRVGAPPGQPPGGLGVTGATAGFDPSPPESTSLPAQAHRAQLCADGLHSVSPSSRGWHPLFHDRQQGLGQQQQQQPSCGQQGHTSAATAPNGSTLLPLEAAFSVHGAAPRACSVGQGLTPVATVASSELEPSPLGKGAPSSGWGVGSSRPPPGTTASFDPAAAAYRHHPSDGRLASYGPGAGVSDHQQQALRSAHDQHQQEALRRQQEQQQALRRQLEQQQQAMDYKGGEQLDQLRRQQIQQLLQQQPQQRQQQQPQQPLMQQQSNLLALHKQERRTQGLDYVQPPQPHQEQQQQRPVQPPQGSDRSEAVARGLLQSQLSGPSHYVQPPQWQQTHEVHGPQGPRRHPPPQQCQPSRQAPQAAQQQQQLLSATHPDDWRQQQQQIYYQQPQQHNQPMTPRQQQQVHQGQLHYAEAQPVPRQPAQHHLLPMQLPVQGSMSQQQQPAPPVHLQQRRPQVHQQQQAYQEQLLLQGPNGRQSQAPAAGRVAQPLPEAAAVADHGSRQTSPIAVRPSQLARAGSGRHVVVGSAYVYVRMPESCWVRGDSNAPGSQQYLQQQLQSQQQQVSAHASAAGFSSSAAEQQQRQQHQPMPTYPASAGPVSTEHIAANGAGPLMGSGAYRQQHPQLMSTGYGVAEVAVVQQQQQLLHQQQHLQQQQHQQQQQQQYHPGAQHHHILPQQLPLTAARPQQHGPLPHKPHGHVLLPGQLQQEALRQPPQRPLQPPQTLQTLELSEDWSPPPPQQPQEAFGSYGSQPAPPPPTLVLTYPPEPPEPQQVSGEGSCATPDGKEDEVSAAVGPVEGPRPNAVQSCPAPHATHRQEQQAAQPQQRQQLQPQQPQQGHRVQGSQQGCGHAQRLALPPQAQEQVPAHEQYRQALVPAPLPGSWPSSPSCRQEQSLPCQQSGAPPDHHYQQQRLGPPPQQQPQHPQQQHPQQQRPHHQQQQQQEPHGHIPQWHHVKVALTHHPSHYQLGPSQHHVQQPSLQQPPEQPPQQTLQPEQPPQQTLQPGQPPQQQQYYCHQPPRPLQQQQPAIWQEPDPQKSSAVEAAGPGWPSGQPSSSGALDGTSSQPSSRPASAAPAQQAQGTGQVQPAPPHQQYPYQQAEESAALNAPAPERNSGVGAPAEPSGDLRELSLQDARSELSSGGGGGGVASDSVAVPQQHPHLRWQPQQHSQQQQQSLQQVQHDPQQPAGLDAQQLQVSQQQVRQQQQEQEMQQRQMLPQQGQGTEQEQEVRRRQQQVQWQEQEVRRRQLELRLQQHEQQLQEQQREMLLSRQQHRQMLVQQQQQHELRLQQLQQGLQLQAGWQQPVGVAAHASRWASGQQQPDEQQQHLHLRQRLQAQQQFHHQQQQQLHQERQLLLLQQQQQQQHRQQQHQLLLQLQQQHLQQPYLAPKDRILLALGPSTTGSDGQHPYLQRTSLDVPTGGSTASADAGNAGRATGPSPMQPFAAWSHLSGGGTACPQSSLLAEPAAVIGTGGPPGSAVPVTAGGWMASGQPAGASLDRALSLEAPPVKRPRLNDEWAGPVAAAPAVAPQAPSLYFQHGGQGHASAGAAAPGVQVAAVALGCTPASGAVVVAPQLQVQMRAIGEDGAAAAAAAIHGADRLIALRWQQPQQQPQQQQLRLCEAQGAFPATGAALPPGVTAGQDWMLPLVLGGPEESGYDTGPDSGMAAAVAELAPAAARVVRRGPTKGRRFASLNAVTAACGSTVGADAGDGAGGIGGGWRRPPVLDGDQGTAVYRDAGASAVTLGMARQALRRQQQRRFVPGGLESEEGCARAMPINLSKLGQHRHKPPPAIRPVRPGHRPEEEAAAEWQQQQAAMAVGMELYGDADGEHGCEYGVPYGGGGQRRRTGRQAAAKAAAAAATMAVAPVGKAMGATAGGVRLKRGGVSGAAGAGAGGGGRSSSMQKTGKILNALREANALLATRFVVRRSSIAQLGVFSTAAIPADTLLMEYHGEAVRTTVADLREKRYAAAGLGCYLFNPGGPPDEAVVLDATQRGNIMRFVNHSCGPNCVSRTLVIDGQRRIFLFSLSELQPGTELSYDYKLSSALCMDAFKGLPEEFIEQAAEEIGVELLLCQCGDRRCRKYM